MATFVPARGTLILFVVHVPLIRDALRRLPYDRSCDQSDGYPERKIYQHHVERKHWLARFEPEIPGAPHRQEEQKQRGHWSEEVKETKEVAPVPGGLYKESERDSPQPAPEQRPVY